MPTLGEIALIVSPFLALIGGIVVAVISSRRNGKTSRETTAVNAQEAGTHEFDALRQGFMDSFEELRRQLAESEARAARDKAELQQQITTSKAQITTLTKRVRVLETQKAEIISHLVQVEKLVPTPPGVPKRPSWN